MKTIKRFEDVRKNNGYGKKLNELGINSAFYWAYFNSKEAENSIINFNDVIWDDDVDKIIEHCKEFKLNEITISCNASGLLDILTQFESKGCKIEGTLKVNSTYKDWQTNERRQLNAIKIIIK